MTTNEHRKNFKEYLVEVTQVVRKYVEGESQMDAEAIAVEEAWHTGVVEQRVTHSEKL